jgi:hypothetical protein
MNIKVKMLLISSLAIVGGLIIWHFTGLYREGRVITEKKLVDYLEMNK